MRERLRAGVVHVGRAHGRPGLDRAGVAEGDDRLHGIVLQLKDDKLSHDDSRFPRKLFGAVAHIQLAVRFGF